ncbi:hypothetical protein THASP1DRAFT_20850, partial [Thamnocephalis sphaerospora]
PWNRAALWQQAGRAGRRRQTSLAVLVAEPHPLDQHYARHPEALFALKAPAACADWTYAPVFGAQLQCAAYERVLHLQDDRRWFGDGVLAVAQTHLQQLDEQHFRAHPSFGTFPPCKVSIRSAREEDTWSVIDVTNGRNRLLETLEITRALFSVYDGAIYVHQGTTYLVESSNVDERYARVRAVHVDWLTRQRDLDPLETRNTFPLKTRPERIMVACGKVQITSTVFGYFKLDARTGRIIDAVDLQMKPVKQIRSGFWVDLPAPAVCALQAAELDQEASVHAAAHLILQLIPTLVLSGEGDLRTECKSPLAKRVRPPRLIFYDAGTGAGVSSKAFAYFPGIVQEAYRLLHDCPCVEGCPECKCAHVCT